MGRLPGTQPKPSQRDEARDTVTSLITQLHNYTLHNTVTQLNNSF